MLASRGDKILAASGQIDYHDGRQSVPETDPWGSDLDEGEPDGTEDVMAG